MVDVEISVFLVILVKLRLNGPPVHPIFRNDASPLFLKTSFMLQNDFFHERRHPFDHDYEIILASVHVLNVFLAEIASVKDKANPLIAKSPGLFQHELQLGHVDDAAGICFIKQWLLIIYVIGD